MTADREADREALINEILADSDAVCACGADPRYMHSLDGWYFDVVQTPDAVIAVVRCPACW